MKRPGAHPNDVNLVSNVFSDKRKNLYGQEGYADGKDHQEPDHGHEGVAHDITGLQTAAGTNDRQEGQGP